MKAGAVLPEGNGKRAQKVYHALAKTRKRVYAAHARCHAALAPFPLPYVQAGFRLASGCAGRWAQISLATLPGPIAASLAHDHFSYARVYLWRVDQRP